MPASTPLPEAHRFPARERHGVLGLMLLFLGQAQYLLFEAISAAAWTDPGYSYFHNLISDLGVINGPSAQASDIDSPLALLMNASFVLLGILSTTGILLLSLSLPPSAHRVAVRSAGIALGAGAILVGVFPANGIGPAHALGAFLNIGSGILLLFLLGARGERYYGMGRWLVRLLLIVAFVAAVAAVALLTVPALFLGVVERVAVYPYVFSFILLALVALRRIRLS